MSRLKLLAIALILVCPLTLPAQRGRRQTRNVETIALPVQGVVIPVHGVLKDLGKKTILVETNNEEVMSLRRTSKTKFFFEGKEIKAADVLPESVVMVDAAEDNDLKLMAVKLTVETAGKSKALVDRQ